MTALVCRSCATPLHITFVDLGTTPLANFYPAETDLHRPDPTYPLHARVCERCLLVQVEAVVPADEIFSDYAYFSSYSDSWVEHARVFCERARNRFGLSEASQVVEVASNDGYLLRHFAQAGIPVLGIEPAANVAEVANAAGVPTEVRFFGTDAAQDLRDRGLLADLLVANNVLAHVPDLNDFVAGLALAISPQGVISIEFPHLLQLIAQVQFDTIYHEHFSYFSLLSLEHVLARHDLRVFDVEELPTHGGSLRVSACHVDAGHEESDSVARLRAKEADFGLGRLQTYRDFNERVLETRRSFRRFLDDAKAAGETVVGYAAAAKGNTLLNSTGTTSDDIAYVVDRSPHKQGRYLPGSRIPVRPPEAVRETRPDVLLVLAWNLRDEVMAQMAWVREWGCRFVVPIPTVSTIP
jgi:SAM-dependent methyltransferase